MFTKKEDWVLDPFNGAGTTTKAAIDLGRNGLGFDIESKYLSISKKRLEAPTSVRQSQLQINPVSVKDFVPKASKGRTRQGSGLKSVSRG
jgi:DNA modification methylase